MSAEVQKSSVLACEFSDSSQYFLQRYALENAQFIPFKADGLERRYFRIMGKKLLFMDASHEALGLTDFVVIAEHLGELGLSAPLIVAAQCDGGLALIEDFGDSSYLRCLNGGLNETKLYQTAVEALLRLHHHPRAKQINLSDYNLERYLEELSIFSHWFAPTVQPLLDVKCFNDQFIALWAKALAPVAMRQDTLTLRNFEVANLMLLAQRSAFKRCGLLDFQDALFGPCEYDLVSLLQDARRDLSPELEQKMLAFYIANAPDYLGSAENIKQRYALLGAQRHARILGVFVKLYQRDNQLIYLNFIPRVLAQFKAALIDAGLTDIIIFLAEKLPSWTQFNVDLQTRLAKDQGKFDAR